MLLFVKYSAHDWSYGKLNEVKYDKVIPISTLEKLFPKEGENSGVERTICMEECVSGLPEISEGNYNWLFFKILISNFISREFTINI